MIMIHSMLFLQCQIYSLPHFAINSFSNHSGILFHLLIITLIQKFSSIYLKLQQRVEQYELVFVTLYFNSWNELSLDMFQLIQT